MASMSGVPRMPTHAEISVQQHCRSLAGTAGPKFIAQNGLPGAVAS
jgi:hypothetical protein